MVALILQVYRHGGCLEKVERPKGISSFDVPHPVVFTVPNDSGLFAYRLTMAYRFLRSIYRLWSYQSLIEPILQIWDIVVIVRQKISHHHQATPTVKLTKSSSVSG